MENHVCCYCGQAAYFQFKNGKWCCHKTLSGCPAQKEKRRVKTRKLWAVRKENGSINSKDKLEKFGVQPLHKSNCNDFDGIHCQYGCGNVANYTLKNGIHCCSEFSTQCPAIREKNSKSLMGHDGTSCSYADLPQETKDRMAWSRGLTKKTDPRIAQAAAHLKLAYQTGEIKPTFLGRRHSEKSRRKMRISAAKYIKSTHGGPRYNKLSIPILESIAKEHDWIIQHAENGGEFYTGIGYFVDAYDKEKNVVLEYDEPKHYIDAQNNILRQKDIDRQNEIIEHLHCEYWRFNEITQTLWKVN